MGESKRKKKLRADQGLSPSENVTGDVGQWLELTAASVENILEHYKRVLEENKEKFNSKNFPYYIYKTSIDSYVGNPMTNKQKIQTLMAIMSVLAAEVIVRQIEDEGREAAENALASGNVIATPQEDGSFNIVANDELDDEEKAFAIKCCENDNQADDLDSHRAGDGDAVENPKDFV